MSQAHNRLSLVDAFKAIASQMIVLHHLSAYGPLAAMARDLLPNLMEWLFGYGRVAVQIFLVAGGFLAARGLSNNAQALDKSPLSLIWKRYQRLVVPFLVAIGFAIVCSAVADRWMDDEAIPARATISQWLAHATLLHGLLGSESLSAGVWYVAIDFQLFALLALLLWAGKLHRFLAPLLVAAVTTASLFWFNRDASWDNWAIYFFGSYGMGVAAWWASDKRRPPWWLGLVVAVVLAALLLEFRLRIAVALATALILGLGRRNGLLERWPDSESIAFLAKISYSLFLVHFPIYLVINAIFTKLAIDSSHAALFGMLLTWSLSVLAATLFHRWVESTKGTQRIVEALRLIVAITSSLSLVALQSLRERFRRVVLGPPGA